MNFKNVAILVLGFCPGAGFAQSETAPITGDHFARIALFGDMQYTLLCPEHETMRDARSAVFAGDGAGIYQTALGQGCVLGDSLSYGTMTEAHVYNYAKISFSYLSGIDIDTDQEIKLTEPQQQFWSYSFTLRDFQNQRVEPIISAALEQN